jgi:hypothetical protein
MLDVVLVVMLVVVLLCRRHHRTLLPPPPLPPPLVGEQHDACYTNADSSPDVGMVLPFPIQGGTTATRVVGE